MKLDVDLGIFIEPGVQFAVLELGEHGAQGGDLLGAGVFGDQACRHALERGPGGDHFDHLALGLADDVNSAARHRAYKAFALELSHGFAHRRAADPEIQSEPPLVEPDIGAAAIDVHGDLEGGIGAGLEAVRAGERLEAGGHRRPRGIRRCPRPNTGSTGGATVGTHLWYTICQTPSSCNREFPPEAPLAVPRRTWLRRKDCASLSLAPYAD